MCVCVCVCVCSWFFFSISFIYLFIYFNLTIMYWFCHSSHENTAWRPNLCLFAFINTLLSEYSYIHLFINFLWLLLYCNGRVSAKSLQLCLTLCDPIDGSPPGSPVPGVLQARILEWVAISFSNAWKWKVKVKSLSHVQLLVIPWTAAYQAPPSTGFSRQEYWSGLPLPSLNGRVE